jgi:hypothetical protein
VRIVKQRTAPERKSHPLASEDFPPTVTFASGAELLAQLGLVDGITADGIRYIARTSKLWPFGPGKQHDYQGVGQTRTMDTQVFVDFFRTGPRRGGRGRK